MSYLVLARKWRPQTFDDVVGQEHVTRTLQNAILANRVAHAFLFCGMRGVGKTTAARLLAKALNCENGPAVNPCNECGNCREITAGSAVDVLEIDGASNRGINEVRQIIENVRYRPAKSRFKIYIIDEVHQVTHDAFNALLKTLEEPPAHVKFIFATTEAHKVPHTILSRCQRYDFKRLSVRQVSDHLAMICRSDGIEIGESALLTIAREGEGSMRDAQSLLDQVIAFAGKTVRDEDVIAALGVADRQILYAVGRAIVERDPRQAVERLAQLHLFGYDLRRFARELLEHFRNMALARLDGGNELLADLSDEERAEVRAQAQHLAAADIDRCFRVMLAAEEDIGRSPYPRLILEMAAIKLATLPEVLPIEEALSRLDALAAAPRSGGGAPAARNDRPASTAGSASLPQEKTAAAEPAMPQPGGGNGDLLPWGQFLAFIAKEKPTLVPHLDQCRPSTPEKGRLDLLVPLGFHHDYLARRDHLALVEQLAGRFFGEPLRVGLRAVTPSAPPKHPAQSKAELTQTALDDPTVRAVMEILGGEVHAVKSKAPAE